jgi:hypothetical protein
MTDERNEWPTRHRSKISEAQPGDEQIGNWPRPVLERMNQRFAERLERAIASGSEHSLPKSEPLEHRW